MLLPQCHRILLFTFMKCIAIRHLRFEDLGTFAEVLVQHGFDIRYVEAGLDAFDTVDWDTADLVVVLGGPIGVNDAADYPWLRQEVDLIAQRLRHGRPTLGICLGAQLMAAALGAAVYPSGAKEIGWSTLQLAPAAKGMGLEALAHTEVLHWHGDTFDLPQGATLLASTAHTAHQAFSYGRAALALQFHAEVHGAHMEPWLVGHTLELRTTGVDVTQLRAASLQNAAAKATAGQAMLAQWLLHVGLAYQPINCEFHDVIEAYATRGETVDIVVSDAVLGDQTIRAVVADVFARKGQEFLVTKCGKKIRLDKVKAMGPHRLMD
jgi:GMP synthase (glutamine-hydrolysing)